MQTAQNQYENAMDHLQEARGLLDGLLYALGDDLGQRACLDGCFESLVDECEQLARYQLGLRDHRMHDDPKIYPRRAEARCPMGDSLRLSIIRQ